MEYTISELHEIFRLHQRGNSTGEERVRNRLQGENGKAGVIAILAMAGIAYYLKIGYHYFGEGLHPLIYSSVVVILGVIALFSSGYALHMKIMGAKPKKHVLRELQTRLTDLEELLKETRTRVKYFEEVMAVRANSMTRRGTDCLSLLKKLSSALDARLYEVKRLLATKNQFDMMDAFELIRQRLIVNENCLESLIDAEPIPALEPYEWEPTITKLLDQIEYELRLVA